MGPKSAVASLHRKVPIIERTFDNVQARGSGLALQRAVRCGGALQPRFLNAIEASRPRLPSSTSRRQIDTNDPDHIRQGQKWVPRYAKSGVDNDRPFGTKRPTVKSAVRLFLSLSAVEIILCCPRALSL